MRARATSDTIMLLSMGYDSLCVWHLMDRPAN